MGLKLTLGAQDWVDVGDDIVITINSVNGIETGVTIKKPASLGGAILSGGKAGASRKIGDGIEMVRRGDEIILGREVVVRINSVSEQKTQLGFEAPRSVKILSWFYDESKNYKNAKAAARKQDEALGLCKVSNPEEEGSEGWQNRGNR